MPEKSQLIDLIQLGHEQTLRFALSLSEDEQNTSGTPERWFSRDILAHVGSGLRRWAEDVAAARAGNPASLPGEAFNRAAFEQYRVCSWQEILDVLQAGYDAMLAQVRSLSDAEWQDPRCFPWGGGALPWRHVASLCFGHPMSHLVQANLARGCADAARACAELFGRQAAALDPDTEWQGVVAYHQACFAALLGDAEPALAHLEASLRHAPRLRAYAREDGDLAALRGMAEFKRLTAGPGDTQSQIPNP